MDFSFKHIIAVTGHYGSGKTNFSVNLALAAAKQGREVIVIDLDIVNPYFRTADFDALLKEAGVTLITPAYANSNLDIPILPASIDASLSNENAVVILDVGGDDAGAIALGRYASRIRKMDYDLLCVINECRFLTKTADEAVTLLREIEAASRLKATGIVNNSNLGKDTTSETVLHSLSFADEVCAAASLPLYCTCIPEAEAEAYPDFFAIRRFVKAPWENASDLCESN